MSNFNRKNHWENIYENKPLDTVSWFQPIPETSLEFIRNLYLDKEVAIIDIGGGDSFLVDHLLEEGYTNITVLDISEKAIERAKERLGNSAVKVKWIVSDITQFVSTEKYDVWHDRAAFHFLTDEKDISKYLEIAEKSINPEGNLLIGTFSESGPTKCSGIEIKQYSEEKITRLFEPEFGKVNCALVDHKTPFDTFQNFIFCSFRRNKTNEFEKTLF